MKTAVDVSNLFGKVLTVPPGLAESELKNPATACGGDEGATSISIPEPQHISDWPGKHLKEGALLHNKVLSGRCRKKEEKLNAITSYFTAEVRLLMAMEKLITCLQCQNMTTVICPNNSPACHCCVYTFQQEILAQMRASGKQRQSANPNS